jgi:hypothetical protein
MPCHAGAVQRGAVKLTMPFLTIEAESTDEARAMAEQLVEEGAFEGWKEDLPDVIVEELPKELTI